jgi:hypothetical protein
MLDISEWINSFRPSYISREMALIRYKRILNNLILYYLKNIYTTTDAVKFIKRLAQRGYYSCDQIMDQLCYLYSQYLPTEIDLARLSLLYQSVRGTQGIEEYATLTIWSCAIQSIMENENKTPSKVKLELIVESPTKIVVKIFILAEQKFSLE